MAVIILSEESRTFLVTVVLQAYKGTSSEVEAMKEYLEENGTSENMEDEYLNATDVLAKLDTLVNELNNNNVGDRTN